MAKSISPRNSRSKGRAGRRTGPIQRTWEQLRSKEHLHQTIVEVLRRNANAGSINLYLTIIGRKVDVEGEGERLIGPEAVRRLLNEKTGISYYFAKAITSITGTDLDVLIMELFKIDQAHPNFSKSNILPDQVRQALNVEHLARQCHLTPDAISLIPSISHAEAVLAESKHSKAAHALAKIQKVGAVTTRSLDKLYPGIGQLLTAATGRTTFQRLDPLDNSAFASIFSQSIRSVMPQSNRVTAWAEFLPCSWETPQFMQAHHLGLFKNVTGELLSLDEASIFAVAYNRLGDQNRQVVHSLLKRTDFRYELYLSPLIIKKIVERRGPFQEATPAILSDQADFIDHLDDLYGPRTLDTPSLRRD